MSDAPEKPHYHGHRDRLRERFLNGGADALADYELIELVLYGGIPRIDVKPLAKDLLKRFGSVAGVINADLSALLAVPGIGQSAAAAIKIVQAGLQHVLADEVRDRPVLANWQRVIDYCRALMAHSKVEEFRLLFLDRKHGLIADELQATGTIDHAPVYPREVARRALELGAAAVIMVHNHPTQPI